MTINNFANLIKEAVEKTLEENEKCKINEVLKNNGLVMIGVSILKDEVNIAPTIYLNSFYEEYCQQKLTINEIVSEVLNIHEKYKLSNSVDLRDFFDFDKVKDRIIFKLINTKENEKLLIDTPHIKMCDLSIIFQCLVSEERIGSATITIHNAHLELWHRTVEELYDIALINTPLYRKYEVKNLKDVLCEMSVFRDAEFKEQVADIPELVPMYVLSNRNGINGAGCILYPKVLENFAKSINDDVYIIPSSIHEVILIPKNNISEEDFILGMIQDVNQNEVSPEEVLSNSLYIYSRNEDIIRVVKEEKKQKMA